MTTPEGSLGKTVETPRLTEVSVLGGFWLQWDAVHRHAALDHQWRNLDATGAIDNFRAAAGMISGPYRSNFASDSDVYKWVDAASRAVALEDSPVLRSRIDEIVELIELAQESDGYVSTWIQTQFPGRRFANLELEHELYCIGHLIEAAISHFEATGSERFLSIGVSAAELLVGEFMESPPSRNDGHAGVEIALVRLYRVTSDQRFLRLATRFVDTRGTARNFALRFLPALARTAWHLLVVRGRQARWAKASRTPPQADGAQVETRRSLRVPARAVTRVVGDSVSGRTFQMHAPVRSLRSPVGHAVRFMYLETAAAMVARETGDVALSDASSEALGAFVRSHMFATGGAGAMPLLEGFGDDYDLDPEMAYAETCAAIGGCMWSRELGLLTGEAVYDDLFEWQLLNAAAAGMSPQGDRYFYDNPLRSSTGAERRSWFPIPCCPSNLSRLWLSLGVNQFSWRERELRIHQYFSTSARWSAGAVEVTSELPWHGEVGIDFAAGDRAVDQIALRIPWWAGETELRVDGAVIEVGAPQPRGLAQSAAGFDMTLGRWQVIELGGAKSARINLSFDMPIRLLRQDERVPLVGGWFAVSRGPLIYCLEGIDNEIDVMDAEIDPNSLRATKDRGLLGGAVVVEAVTVEGDSIRFIPYFLWANRGRAPMSLFVRSAVAGIDAGLDAVRAGG